MAITSIKRRPPSVRDGVRGAGTFALRPKRTPQDGAIYYATDLDRLLLFDAQIRAWLPTDGGTLYVAGQKYLVDRFARGTLDANYAATVGTDTDPGDAPVIDADDGEGSVVGVTGDAGTGVAADGSALAGPLVWEAEEATSATVYAARFKVSAITTVEYFLGLTDVLPSTTLEMPFHFTSGTAITANATDACGFLFDTTATTDTIRLVGVKNTTQGTAVDSGAAPVAANYADYVMIVDTAGDAYFFIDGTYEGTVANAVSPGVDLCPIVIANATTTATRTWNCRKLVCHQDW